MEADLLLHSASQLVTCGGGEGPRRGQALADVGIIPGGAVAIRQGQIVAVGTTGELRSRVEAREEIDAGNRAVCPGFVDAHTHTVFGGDRIREFEMRIEGATYMEIMAAGGGIVSTMRQTRQASVEELAGIAQRRLDEMLAQGTTTVEIKSGYGLDPESELKMLRAVEKLDRSHPCDAVPTFLGAHTVPPEFAGDAEGYTRQVIIEMLPRVAEWYRQSHFAAAGVPLFADVFCEDHAFSVAQSQRILQSAADLGLALKIHVDQFNSFGGVTMALALGATSLDHLDVTGPEEIRRLAGSDSVAVLLPAVNFNLGGEGFADARALVEAGAAVALATDFNPGSAPCLSLPLTMAIATRFQRLLPAEALNATTINAAHAIGLAGRVGSIEVGKQADLLLLKEADYRSLSYYFGHNPVQKVLKRGQVVWASA